MYDNIIALADADGQRIWAAANLTILDIALERSSRDINKEVVLLPTVRA